MKYRLVCFDAGFTLIQPRRDMVATLAAILADEGLSPSEEALRQAWDVADRWFWEEYHKPGNPAWVADATIRETWRNYNRMMLGELGIDDLDHRLADAMIASHFSWQNWQLYPDVLPVLGALHAAEVQLGVISDWGSNLTDILSGLGIDQYFDFILASAAAGACKPNVAFYRMALSRADVAAQHALMIGDSYHADVLGGRDAGMDTLLLDRNGTATATDVQVVRSLEEALAIVRET